MRSWAPMVVFLSLILAAACATTMKPFRVDMVEMKQAPRWDVFFMEKGQVKVAVYPASEFEFREGCFIVAEPVPMAQCDVFRYRPCTENCGG